MAGVVTTVLDFTVGSDKVSLALSIFTTAGVAGTLAPTAFHTGAAAHDADDRIVYNAATGALMFDPDGTGAKSARTFAELTSGLALNASDFLLA